MKLLDSLKTKLASRITTKQEQLKKLRVDAADGKDVDLDDAASLLEALDMTPEDFLKQVETLNHRRHLLKVRETGIKATAEMVPVKAKLKKQGDELAEIVEKRTAENQVLRHKIDRLRSESSEGQQAHAELTRGAECPSLTRRTDECNRRLKKCIESAKSIDEFLQNRDPGKDMQPGRAQLLKDQKKLRKELGAEIDELKAEQASLFEGKLDPNSF